MATYRAPITLDDIPRYQAVPETTEELDWANLVALDLSIFDKPGGKQELAAQLKEAIHEIGFFYIVNHGFAQEELDAQFDIGKEIFNLPLNEKKRFNTNLELPGGPLGYKARGLRDPKEGIKDNLELYDDPNHNDHFKDRPRPEPCIRRAAELEKFTRHLHQSILYKLCVLSAIILELEDEETLYRFHNYDRMSNCKLRWMIHHPRSPEEIEILTRPDENHVYGHTDFGTFTFLVRQPVAALQVRLEDGAGCWKWVKPLAGSIVVNVADSLSFLSGGYLKSSIHRVVLPPADQRHVPRLGVIYFTRPDDDTPLIPVESPLIERVGNTSKIPLDSGLTAGEWSKARYKAIPKTTKDRAANNTFVGNIHVPTYA